MKKLFAILMAVCMLAGLCTVPTFAADEAVVYLKAGGTGDGSSEANATGTLADAMAAAAAKTTDAKIQVVGEIGIDLTGYFVPPVHTNMITITGEGTNGKIVVSNPQVQNWYLKGALAFEHIEFNLLGHLLFNADFNDIYFLEGVSMTSETGFKTYVRAVDPTSVYTIPEKFDQENVKFTGDQKIVCLSGTFGDIVGYGQNGITAGLDGDVTIVFGGTAVADTITVQRASCSLVDNATIIIDGGVINQFVSFCDRPMSDLTKYGATGPKNNCTIIVTDNFDPTASFTVNPAEGVFLGFAGTTIWTADAKTILDYEAIPGTYTIKAEAQVFDKLGTTYVNADSFDGAIEKIASGTGLPKDLIPGADANEQPENPGTGTDTPENPGTGTDTPSNPNTGDMTWAVAVVAAVALMGSAIVLKKREN